MSTTPRIVHIEHLSHSRDVMFAGDGVLLAGEMDYPDLRTPQTGFPLLFIVPNTACPTRDDCRDLVQIGIEAGFAVFRWDRRGMGRSGAGGSGSTTQDAVEAYATALSQPQIDQRRAIIVAHSDGTRLLGSAFGLFARVRPPYAALLLANMLDPEAVQALDTRIHILQGELDWNPWQVYSQAACRAHRTLYRHGATYTLLPSVERDLMSRDPLLPGLHPIARGAISDWFGTLFR